MRKGEIMSRLFAAVVTIGFLTAVRPDAEPERWSTAMLAILLYEGIKWSAEYIQKVNRKQRKRQAIVMNRKAMKEDGKRLDEFWIRWPLKEVN